MSARCRQIFLPIALLLLSAACSPEHGEAARTVETFYGLLNAGDYRAAVQLYDVETSAAVRAPDGAPSELFADWAKEETRNGAVDKLRIISEKTAGNTTTVDFQIVYEGGSPARRSVPLTQVDGQWKLGFIRDG